MATKKKTNPTTSYTVNVFRSNFFPKRIVVVIIEKGGTVHLAHITKRAARVLLNDLGVAVNGEW